MAVDFGQGLGRARSPPSSWPVASPEPASPGTQKNWLAKEAKSLMDVHCVIKVQLGPGAVLYLSARYSLQVAQLACAEAIWPGQSPDFGLVSPSLGKPVLQPFGVPRAHLRKLNSSKSCLRGYLRMRIQKLANGSQTEAPNTRFTKQAARPSFGKRVLCSEPTHMTSCTP